MKRIYDYIFENSANTIEVDRKTLDAIKANTEWLIQHMGLDDEDVEVLDVWTSGKVMPAGSEPLVNRVPVLHVAMFYKTVDPKFADEEYMSDMIRWEADDYKKDFWLKPKTLVMIDAVHVRGEQDIRKYINRAKKESK